jgi:hypothetical protein
MKREKCYIVTHANGTTTTKTSFDPYANEVRNAKAAILEAADSGAPITICVIEHVNSRTFSTDGKGDVKARTTNRF